tara:strand:+ start:46 stop:624 length:579 start_codon:yes stop_codon:yes gene_type:complete
LTVNIVSNKADNAGTIAFTTPLANSAQALPCAILFFPRISTIIFLPDGPSIPPKIPKIIDRTPIKNMGEISIFTIRDIKTNTLLVLNLEKNKTSFLGYLSAILPPIGAANGLTRIGKEAIMPTIKEESVFSSTYQFTKINLKKNVEKANAPETKRIEKRKLFLLKINHSLFKNFLFIFTIIYFKRITKEKKA